MSSQRSKRARTRHIAVVDPDSDSDASTRTTVPVSRGSQNNVQPNEVQFFSQSDNLLSVPKHELKHRNGSIVRVKLENFITYDACEFFPGPNMNMVIGPNGAGKSAIVCALALGLGGPPGLLGRAKELSEFVKRGKEKAVIEIELSDDSFEDNKVIITRMFQISSKLSTWKINNRHATKQEVSSKISAFNIQVDNLCQFLPQDKVAEFAELNSTRLLLATQKAAGIKNMEKWHTDLISLRQQQKEALSSTESDQKMLASLEASNQNLEKEVEAFNQREAIEKKILLYKLRIPAARYKEAKNIYENARTRREKALAAKKRLDEKLAPLEEAIKKEEKAIEALEKTMQASNLKLKSIEKKREISDGKLDALVERSEEIKRDLDKAKQDQDKRLQTIQRLETTIAQLQEQVDAGGPDESHLKPILDKMDLLKPEMKEVDDELAKIQSDIISIQSNGPKLIREVHSLDKELNRLNDAKQQRIDILSRYDKSTGFAIEWLSKNQNMFKEKVFNPLILEINIKDMRYAQGVENCFNARALKTFLCQNKDDYDIMNQELNDKRKLRINVVCLDPKPLSSFRPPVPLDQLKKWGFDDYALNLVEGPPPVLVALCNLCNFHSIPISLTDVNNLVVEESRLLFRYIAGKIKYTLLVSDYGARKITVETQNLAPGKFVQAGVDQDKRKELLDKRSALQQRMIENEDALKVIKRKENEFREKETTVRTKRESLLRERKRIYDEMKRFEKLRLNLESRITDLDNLKKEDFEAKISLLQQELIDSGRKQIHHIGTAKALSSDIVDARLQILVLKLKLAEAKSKGQYVERKKAETDHFISKAQEIYLAANSEAQRQKKIAEAFFKKAEDVMSGVDRKTREELRNFGIDLSLKELEDGLSAEEARMKYLPGVSEETLQDYHKRREKIKTLRETLEKRIEDEKRISQEINKTFREWEPCIEELVKKISTNFSRGFSEIGCVGEVQLRRHEDFDQWGIDILVKFRETEKLQLLSGQRQSGGEKSVSTIMYLMAIQELAQSPFRVVDEINQGMDPQNERLIHKQLVRVACRPKTAQYFLITPKLLSDLAYHPHMKVLCIFNGEWQPDHFNVKKYVTTSTSVLPSKRAHVATQDYY